MTITLFKTIEGWMARDDDPRTVALFGTDTLPTAFTAEARPETVRAAIARRNPDATVLALS